MKTFYHHKKRLSFIFSTVFVLHFLVLHGALTGFVLCIGNDGHVAMERSSDSNSCENSGQIESATFSKSLALHCNSEASHCGECRDVSLNSDCRDEQSRISKNELNIRTPVFSFTTFLPLNFSADEPIENVNFCTTIISTNAIKSLKSTILLI